MKAVLYTYDLEPITVIELPISLWELLWLGRPIRLHVVEPVSFEKWQEGTHFEPLKIVEIFGEKIIRRGKQGLMLFADNEEWALRLKASFLPGQYFELQSRERGAYISGVLRAISHGND